MVKDGYNLWLSAHTHTPSLNENGSAIRYGTSNEGYKTVHHLNVGSTTDYRPHAAIVKLNPTHVEMVKVLSMDESDTVDCSKELYAKYEGTPEFVEEQLGLTKSYRKQSYDTNLSRRNIDEFLSRQGEEQREYWVKCLMNIAAKNENKQCASDLFKPNN